MSRVSRAMRWPTVVMLLAAGLFAWEFTHRHSPEEGRDFRLNLDAVRGLNLTDTIAELYPGRGDTHTRKAIQAGECFNRLWAVYRDPQQQLPAACRQYDAESIIAATRAHFEEGIATGVKDDEQLHYLYVWFLMRIGADREEIDRARREWRRLFPLSRKADPTVPSP